MQDAPVKRIRRKIRWTRLFVFMLFLALLGYGAAKAAMYAYIHVFPASSAAQAAMAAEQTSDRINILLLGIDDSDPQNSFDTSRRTDTMILASVSLREGSVYLLSIPRDTRVMIPGHKGYDKINHAYAYGGTELARLTVEQFLHIPVHHYLVLDWQGFIKTVDVLGGVDLYVEHNMHYEDPYANLKINLKKGYQHLDGEKAGEYVRFRSDELGDIGRVQRQQRFLKSLADQALQIGTLVKIPALFQTANQYIHSDMTALETARLAGTLAGVRAGSLHTEMLPGDFATINGISYWVTSDEQSQQAVQRMMTPGFSTAASYHSDSP